MKVLVGLFVIVCSGMALADAPGAKKVNNLAPPAAGPYRCSSQKHLVNLSVNDSGQTVEGPVCAQVTVNALKYAALLSKKYATPTAGQSLGSVLPSTFGGGGGNPKIVNAPSLDRQFHDLNSQAKQLYDNLFQIDIANREQGAFLTQDLSTLQNTIAQSDTIFNQSGPDGILALLNRPQIAAILNKVPQYQFLWKATNEQLTKLESLQLHITILPIDYPTDIGTVTGDPCLPANANALGWTNWDKCYDAQYKAVQSEITAALTLAAQWTSDSDKAAQFVKNLNVLNYWSLKAATLTRDQFVLQAEVLCGVLFNQNQAIAVNLITTDQTGMFPGQTAQQPVTVTLLNVNCSSAFAVSAGVAFSLIKNPQFAIVQTAPPSGSTTPGSIFGATSNSAINPYPVALAHARLKDWNDNRYAVHYSFGAGVNPAGSNGTNPDFLTGFSLSFLRTIFLTGGLDVGKQSSLAGGFRLGDTVPSGVTTVPTSSSYKAGFGFAITFTKP
jgi:hypothetical protein